MIQSLRTVAIIPARLDSSRLPRKALADILGLPMIVHVFKRCLLANNLNDVYVATDSFEIKEVVESHGGKVIMTSSSHETGTDRIAEAAQFLDVDIVVNVQGDEALVNPTYIDKVALVLQENPEINVSILVNSFDKRKSNSDIKVVLNEYNDVMYFSRTDIPSDARVDCPLLLKAYHIVPFRKDFLIEYSKWEKGRLEKIEFNEYLRILEKGYKIRAVHVESDALSVDTEEDLEYVRKKMKNDIYFPRYA
ncbi:3-deoxy-manno-octulosonate cytidylyltransferase [Candidatus Woesearchaeota archaeon]|nr:3-deoxy-manno-octulosonate cytidylyltransferase [Candidatus Woesearchaeota archaeon]